VIVANTSDSTMKNNRKTLLFLSQPGWETLILFMLFSPFTHCQVAAQRFALPAGGRDEMKLI
jgi:hypothetical protein